MLLEVRHRTRYTFDREVFLEPHVLRLQPTDSGAQTVEHFAITIDPEPAGQSLNIDLNGGVAREVWFSGSHINLTIETHAIVRTLRENPFNFILIGDNVEHIPVVYDEHLAKLLAPALDTSIIDAKVAAFAEDVAKESGSGTLSYLSRLVVRIREHCELVQRETGPAWPAGRTLSQCSGSCRDLAVLFMACARHMGIAARFVSGYSVHGEGNDQEMHAWSEVYLPGGGWRGYDPSASMAVGTGYIRLAAAAHSSYAAPVIGTYRGTGVAAKVAYHIEIHELERARA